MDRDTTASGAAVSDIDTLLASYDITYAWNYGSVKEGLRDLYEKAKRDQWNGSVQLDWSTQVDPEGEIINLRLAKHRNGPTGETKLYFRKKQTRFVSYADESRYANAGPNAYTPSGSTGGYN